MFDMPKQPSKLRQIAPWLGALALGVAFCAAGAGIAAQTDAPYTAQLTVSAEASHGNTLPAITADDVMVMEGKDRDKVTSWIPAQGDQAGLELLVLIDEGSSLDLASHFKEIQAFLMRQPATTLIGVGYMQYGMVEMQRDFTSDHVAAGKALRIPMGVAGASASPYFALQDLSKHWPADAKNPRHEVLMISSGIDPDFSGGLVDPYVLEAVGDMQRAGVVVYAIYEPGAGHAGHSFWRNNMGQSYLSQLCEETGGESYYLGTAAAVNFTPYLDEFARQLQHQFLLTFNPKPRQAAGFQNVHVTTELASVDLVAADKVYVPAGQ